MFLSFLGSRRQSSGCQQTQEALRQETERLAQVVAVQDAIAAAPPGDAVLQMIAERAKELVNAADASICFADGQDILCRVSTRQENSMTGYRVPVDRSIVGHCLRSGEVIHCRDASVDHRANPDARRRFGARSMILVPLRRQGIPGAVLTVYSAHANAFQDADVKTLQLMAGFLEGVMAHAAAFEEKKRLLDEQTKAFQALQEVQQRFEALMNNSPAATFVKDDQGRYVYVNAEMERRFERKAEEWIGKTDFEIFEPEVAKRLAEKGKVAFHSDKRMEVAEDVPTPQGMRHWLVFKFILRDAQGRRYLAGKALDITERKRAESQLFQQERLFRQVLDALPIGVVIADGLGKIFRTNPAAEKIWGGMRCVGLDGLDQYKARWPETGKPVEPHEWALARAITCHEKSPSQVVEIEAFDGTRKTIDTRAVPVFDADGKLAAAVVLVEDVTQQIQAEKALAASERFARATVDALTTQMAILDANGTIVSVNQAWRRFAEENGQFPTAVGVGVNYLEVCDRATGQDADLAASAAQGIRSVMSGAQSDFYLEYPCHSPNTERWFVMRVTRFEADGVARLLIAHENITSRKLAERLDRERASLRDAVRAMDQVLGVVGHELRTPLAAVRAMSEFLLTDGARQTAEWDRFLREMGEVVDGMSDTVNNILEAARLNSGRAKWNWGPVDVAATCTEAVETVRPLIDPQRVQLSLSIQPDLATMLGDGEAVRRLIVNLLSNARKHTDQGSIDIKVEGVEQNHGRWIRLNVSDTGHGIPPEILARLGEAFALNSGVVGATHVGGTGLGLAICRGIVAAHGGEIRFTSEQGKGTTVTATLRTDLPHAVQGESSPVSDSVERVYAITG